MTQRARRTRAQLLLYFLKRHAVLLLLPATWNMVRPLEASTVVGFEEFSLSPDSNLAATALDYAPLQTGDLTLNRRWSVEYDCCPAGWAVSNQTQQDVAGIGSAFSARARGTGGGGYQSPQFAVASNFERGEAAIDFAAPASIAGMYVTNIVYTYLAIKDGNDGAGFVKGPFQDGDWFRLDVVGLDAAGQETGRVPFYLADFRDGQSLVVDDWTWVDLELLGTDIWRLEFEMDSTDVGMFGINTPAYFAVDNLQYALVPEPAAGGCLVLVGMAAVLGGLRLRRK